MHIPDRLVAGLGLLLAWQTPAQADLDVHDDYYRGFAQGAYYGLMLAGEEYDVAWCMRGELEVEARGMGQGADFQKTLERLLAECRETYPTREQP
jgi:hypothetical protein